MTRVGNQTNSTDPDAINSRIFVGNLNTYLVSKEELENIFQRYGRIRGISMHKGYAFVQFTDTWDARNAVMGEDGRTVAGQVLDVNMVLEPKPHQVVRKRSNNQLLNPSSNYLFSRQAMPPVKRPRTELTSVPFVQKPKLKSREPLIHPKSYQSDNSDILICGNCKELFSSLQKLIEHKKQSCKLRFTCKCHHSSSTDSPKNINCAHCQTKCSTWWDLIQHVQGCHGISIYQNTNMTLTGAENGTQTSTSESLASGEFNKETVNSDTQSGLDDNEWEQSPPETIRENNLCELTQEKAVDTNDLEIMVEQG
ncbi:serine/arginine-rich splicing factor 5-like [Centruroides vittatus]|uniref:serine/arginine-rich splicing factor 5-like n=1 Tax=Centruroides vittatus TaxID=120091 RepID=UPI00350F4778